MKEKEFIKIGEAAKSIHIHEQTIRDYERKGLIRIRRSENNTRMFSSDDLLRIDIIITLTQELGMNLNGVKLVFALQRKMEMADDELLDYITDNINDFRV
ncbi:MAG: MerR family transcriptional regulator [Candidatus Cloacimonetes bacterium]|nr:MerR family transcriptional regulator [Candidatus Cloacimonadota bacterium]